MKRTNQYLSAFGLLFLVGCGIESEAFTDQQGNASERAATTRAALALPGYAYSARRDPTKDWKQYADAAKTGVSAASRSSSVAAASREVYDSRTDVANADLSKVPVWTDADIVTLFRATRDARYMVDDNNFIRRPSWLYPDDGCWVRAELAAIAAAEAGKPKPYKLFSFGNLTVATPNAPGGSVSWWYHVVPLVKNTSGQAYVLDAAIDDTRPLPWKTWLLKQVPVLTDVEVTIADSNAYHPGSPTIGGDAPSKDSVVSDLSYYLSAEWSRQSDLGRDPVTQLGYFPPWGNVGKDFDRDGKSDILWRNGSTGAVQISYMKGVTQSGTVGFSNTLGAEWRLAGTGDFDRDGRLDVIWHNGTSGEVQVWYMDKASKIGSGSVDRRMPDSLGWILAGADDFNYDGKTDLVWRNGITGYTQFWYLDNGLRVAGGANLDPRNLVKDNSGWSFAGTGDFNRDGKTDVVWRNGSSGETRIWYLDGMTKQGEASLSVSVTDSSGWRLFSVRDFNYDGRVDLLWHNGNSGETQLWYLDGFNITGSSPLPIVVADSSGWSGAGY